MEWSRDVIEAGEAVKVGKVVEVGGWVLRSTGEAQERVSKV